MNVEITVADARLRGALETLCVAAREAGGRALLVGGCVRDALLGLPAKDLDLEVYGLPPARLVELVSSRFPVDLVGESFGVLKLRGLPFDVALPRRESRTGLGHKAFSVFSDPWMPVAEACSRRDFTLNALAADPLTGELLDPFGGVEDLKARCLRHTSDKFVEDPLRVLRGMQLASRFELTAAPETVALCRRMKAEFTTLAKERVREEWIKWAARSRRPSLGLRLLEATEWLEHFPELRALVGTPQDPEWHPEGDVFTHTCHCCDALVDLPGWRAADEESRVVYMLAVLAHDFAKPATTHQAWRDERWRLVSPGHEEAGGPLCERFLERLDLPLHWRRRVLPLVTHHLAHLQPLTDRAVRRLALRLEPESIEGLCLVMTADHHGRPPKPREAPASVRELLERAAALRLAAAAPKPLLQGRHLLDLGLSPGPHLGRILKAAFEAQLEGAFADLEGARRWFLERRQDFELAERSRPS